MGETKVCTQCNEENMLSEFYIDKRALDEHRSECKVCTRGSRLKYHFGITLDDYNKIKKQQDNKCCICKLLFDDVIAHLDHCHTTKQVRGILCSNCNQGLGQFKDNVDNLSGAINYLLTSKKKYDISI
jgi:hypothetical protein